MDRQAALLLVLALEMATTAGLLHRAWAMRDQPEAHEALRHSLQRVLVGRGPKHHSRFLASLTMGEEAVVASVLAVIVDAFSRKQPDMTVRLMEMLVNPTEWSRFGDSADDVRSYVDQLRAIRESVYVDFRAGQWVSPVVEDSVLNDLRDRVRRIIRATRRGVDAEIRAQKSS